MAAVTAKNALYSSGLTLYYSSRIGYNLIAPSLESGFYTGLALLSLSSVPVTYVTGSGVAVVNQVAFTGGSAGVGAAQTALGTTYDASKYVALMTMDVVTESSKILFNQTAAGVVLGYTALTQVPAHMFTGVVDGVMLLAYDGSRLVLILVNGEKDGVPVEALPVGTVLDLKEISKDEKISITEITSDQEVIEKVVEKSPQDIVRE